MTRPCIAVTLSRRSAWRVFPLISLAVGLAGGRAIAWTAGDEGQLEDVDGLIIGGGDDISPDLYGGLVTSARLHPDRDRMEARLAAEAWRRNLPDLGICRRAQMLNVAFGGSLNADASGVYLTSRQFRTVRPRKRVQVQMGTRLAIVAGLAPMRVNALHTQAVDRLGRSFRVAARDSGGMVQAIERIHDPFALGVQWHPELLPYARRQRAIFGALVAAARARMCDAGQVAAVGAV